MGIRGDRRNYFMSVEFAMQRELQYRNNLEIKASHQSHLQLPEVPKPTLTKDTRGAPRPTLNAAYVAEHPGSEPLSRPPPYPHPPSQRQSGPVPLPEGIFSCKVCQLDCKTGFNLLSHYQGHKHKAKVQRNKGKEVAGGTTPKPNEKRPYCDVCQIWCADEYTFRMHFSCTNHILRHYDWLMKKRMLL